MTLVTLFFDVDENICKTSNSHVQLQLEYHCKGIKYKILSDFLFAHSFTDMRPFGIQVASVCIILQSKIASENKKIT